MTSRTIVILRSYDQPWICVTVNAYVGEPGCGLRTQGDSTDLGSWIGKERAPRLPRNQDALSRGTRYIWQRENQSWAIIQDLRKF